VPRQADSLVAASDSRAPLDVSQADFDLWIGAKAVWAKAVSPLSTLPTLD